MSDTTSSPSPEPTAGREQSPAGRTLEVREGNGAMHRVTLDAEFSIGRAQGDLVVEDDPFLSGQHLRLLRRWGQVVVEDLDSTNGVFLAIGEEVELREGDEIRIGGQLFRFEP